MTEPAFRVHFWGVRDHIATPGPETASYGGNTPCIEVRCGDALLILDAGTGIRPLGQRLLRDGAVAGDIVFSHTQFDRIAGLPFFAAAFSPRNAFRLWAARAEGGQGIEGVLRNLMMDPIFPVPIDVMSARLDFHDFKQGDVLRPAPGVEVATMGFGTARQVTGYRVHHAGHALCYVTDVPASDAAATAAVARFIAGADLAILGADSQAGEASNSADKSWRWALGIGQGAGVHQLVLSNHGLDAVDARLDRVAGAMARSRPTVTIAREGLEIVI